MVNEGERKSQGSKEVECKYCKSKAPPGSKFCNACGKSLVEEELVVVNAYADFLQRMNEDQTKVFKWTVTFGGAVLTLFLGIFGIGSYQGIKTYIDDSLNKSIKEQLTEHASSQKVEGLINEYAMTKVDESFDTLFANLYHESGYNYVQLARAFADKYENIQEPPYANDVKTVKNYFKKARRNFIKNVKKYPEFPRSWFELGRLFHYYPLKYNSFLTVAPFVHKLKKEDHVNATEPTKKKEQVNATDLNVPELKKNRQVNATDCYESEDPRACYLIAISKYDEEDKAKYYHAEPTFYVAQLTLKYFYGNQGETQFAEDDVIVDLQNAIDALGGKKKYKELKEKVKKVKISAGKRMKHDVDMEILKSFYPVDCKVKRKNKKTKEKEEIACWEVF